jgi:hypothetical protein
VTAKEHVEISVAGDEAFIIPLLLLTSQIRQVGDCTGFKILCSPSTWYLSYSSSCKFINACYTSGPTACTNNPVIKYNTQKYKIRFQEFEVITELYLLGHNAV